MYQTVAQHLGKIVVILVWPHRTFCIGSEAVVNWSSYKNLASSTPVDSSG